MIMMMTIVMKNVKNGDDDDDDQDMKEMKKERFQMLFATDREPAHAWQHVTANVQSCQAVLRCQSRRTDGLEAPRLEIFMQRAPQLTRSPPLQWT